MTDLSDELLLKKLVEGDTRSLGILYERHKTVLFTYFHRVTKDYDASNDLLMETFERIYKYRLSYKPDRKVRPWIFQIATNLIRDHFKKSKRWESIDRSGVKEAAVHPKLSLDATQSAKQLEHALSKLTPSQRNVLSMYYLLEMGYGEISDIEGITVNNARIKICRGLKKLHELLKNSGI